MTATHDLTSSSEMVQVENRKYILLLILFLRYACKKFTGYQVGWKWPSQGDEFGRFFLAKASNGFTWFYHILPEHPAASQPRNSSVVHKKQTETIPLLPTEHF